MSDSDDTDVLLLIPPDLFIVPSSDSEDSDTRRGYSGSAVVSEILEAVQSLETRIIAIESKDNSLEISALNNSIDYQFPQSFNNQNSSRFGKFSNFIVPSLPNTPLKPRHSSSVKSSPSSRLPSVGNSQNNVKINWSKEKYSTDNNEQLILGKDENSMIRKSAENFEILSTMNSRHNIDTNVNGGKNDQSDDRRDIIREMELSEVDDLLQEMEATEIELARRINSSNSRSCARTMRDNLDCWATKNAGKIKSPMRRLDLQFVDDRENFENKNFMADKNNSERLADISLPDDNAIVETERIIAGFKNWENNGNDDNTRIKEGKDKNDSQCFWGNEKINNPESYCKNGDYRNSKSSETSDAESQLTATGNCRSLPNIQNYKITNSTENDSQRFGGRLLRTNDEIDDTRKKQFNHDYQRKEIEKNRPRKPQKLPTLSDFWDCDGTKSQEEMSRIKLEEEKFRREHCEHVIQELQKRLLEQQEKVAVAIRVDNQKNTAISQFQYSWSNLKQGWKTLEAEHSELESSMRNMKEKHESEIAEFQRQIKRGESELSKALDLAAGYKEKSDNLVAEKLDLLKNHADELENYKSLVQEAEMRYEKLKIDYNKITDKLKQLEDTNNNSQIELNKERLRNSEVRNEMAVIHKALDACEAELTVLRQEKDNLSLKVREEIARNGILEQNKNSVIEAMNEARNSEKAAKDEVKALIDRQEQIRSELREVYQNQVEEVVKTKLKEFQQQLDAAEMSFQVDLETKQRAIAECAARKIKSIIDKHQLEINLLEEKQMEEKRLGEIQLAQASQKAAMLESQLNNQRATKTQLAEQLHSVMQKQWQQALQIISGGNMENLSPLQRLNAERLFEVKKSKRCHSACCNKESRSLKAELRSSSSQNLQNSRHDQDESLVTLTSNDETPLTTRKDSKDDLRKYIKMILDSQQPRDDFSRRKYIEQSNPSPPPIIREVPRKHYTKKEINGLSEESVTWQNIDEESVLETSEYIPMPHPQGNKIDHQKYKPPWK